MPVVYRGTDVLVDVSMKKNLVRKCDYSKIDIRFSEEI